MSVTKEKIFDTVEASLAEEEEKANQIMDQVNTGGIHFQRKVP